MWFFGAVLLVLFFTCVFLVFVVLLVSVWAVEFGAAWGVAAGACAGAWAANVNGMVATAKAIASKLFFIFSFFSVAGRFARSQFHDAACADFPR
jgi:hypothetical protein